MRKNILLAISMIAVMLTSCNSTITNKSDVQSTIEDGERLEENIDSLNKIADEESNIAEENFKEAKEAYNMAIANGDKNAQLAAEKALNEAITALEKTKQSILSSNEKMKEISDTIKSHNLDTATNAIKQKLEQAGTDIKKAAQSTESTVKGLVNDISKKAKEEKTSKSN